MAAFAVSLPLPWHWRAKNIATLSIIFWLLSANLVILVNAIIWADNYNDLSPIWCDICEYPFTSPSYYNADAMIPLKAGRVITAAGIAIPICCLTQMRRLEAVASTRTAGISPTKNHRRVAWDLIFCLGFPVIHVALRYIVQGHRYDIIEDIGCIIPFVFTWPSLIILHLVPLLISLAAVIYASE